MVRQERRRQGMQMFRCENSVPSDLSLCLSGAIESWVGFAMGWAARTLSLVGKVM